MNKLLLTLGFCIAANLGISKDVLISFDGSARLDMWQESLDISKNENVKFTYYISAPYFLTVDDLCDHPYWAIPKYGEPALKFRPNTPNERRWIAERYNYLNRAISQGCEIGSHLCGHYNGWNWTKEDWQNELDFFKWTYTNHGNFDFNNIKGIRAPCLGVNKNYKDVIYHSGYLYDSSWVYSRLHTPAQSVGEVPMWKILLVRTAGILRLPFDYEMGIMKDIDHTPKFQEDLFFDSLCQEYNTNDGLPLQICLHFEKFEGDPYWNATKRFIEWVKDKNPRYMTYLEYFREMK